MQNVAISYLSRNKVDYSNPSQLYSDTVATLNSSSRCAEQCVEGVKRLEWFNKKCPEEQVRDYISREAIAHKIAIAVFLTGKNVFLNQFVIIYKNYVLSIIM